MNKIRMIARRCRCLAAMGLLLSQGVQGQTAKGQLERPKLVVGIMVDQMRWDYIYRFYDRYGQDGFKRMLNTGFSNENTYINHLPTVTAIGHTSVYTGSVPAMHGITGNDFIVQATGKGMYCADDSTVTSVGADDKGGMSPRNMLVSTVTDELRLATNFRSKVIGVAIKDRGAIFPGGHMANAAYWFGKDAQWVSSTYYMQSLPQWVQDFNKGSLADDYLKNGWSTLYPMDTYVQSATDDNPYEGKLSGTDRPTLPIAASVLKANGRGIIRDTPFGNSYTLDFAKAAVQAESLGNNPAGVPDFLTISLSSTDGIGHRYGVNALEVEDMYLRLDRDLAAFFQFLDEEIGKGNYLVFLTADHGASHNNPFYLDHKGGGGYLSANLDREVLNEKLKKQFGHTPLIIGTNNHQIHLNHSLLKSKGLNMDEVKSFLLELLNAEQGVVYAVDNEQLASATILQPIKDRIINSYRRDRSGAITLIKDPQWKGGNRQQTGTGHGDWNPYDAHVPLLWMGWGIPHGASNVPVHMTDIAPTVSALLHIQEPNGNIGKPIAELLRTNP